MPTTPIDPLYNAQWHFALLGDIETIWDEFTGAGVSVGVYDDGVEYSHVDLSGNYDASLHFVYGGTTYDPLPIGLGDAHGTAVAGLIGATEGNGVGGVGVALDVSLTGVNILSDIWNEGETVVAAALDWAQNFDIMNNSWGYTPYFDDFQNLTEAGDTAALVDGNYEDISELGRGGLGTIVVQAAGNDRLNANGDGINISRFSVSIAATDSNGDIADYSNYGSSILVAGPAGSETTDLTGSDGYDTGNYTNTFGGTSAATPVTSGVIALMLEANPGLGWRDVQNILAISASLTGSAIGDSGANYEYGGWFINGAANWNGGGNSFHLSYGFGMVDAFAAVRMAEVWDIMFDAVATSLNEQHVSMSSGTINMAILDHTTDSDSMLVTTDINVEQIMVTVDMQHDYAEDVILYLVAPDDTRFMLMENYASSDLMYGGFNWTFGITGALDMSSFGSWTLEASDDWTGDEGTLYSWSLDFYGSAAGTDDVHHFTDDYLTMINLDANRAVISDTNGGTDWLNFATQQDDMQINLATGVISATGLGTFANIANGSIIENAISGDGDDLLTSSSVANELSAMRGDDTLYGEGGSDELLAVMGPTIYTVVLAKTRSMAKVAMTSCMATQVLINLWVVKVVTPYMAVMVAIPFMPKVAMTRFMVK